MPRRKSSAKKERLTLWLQTNRVEHLERLKDELGKASIGEVVRDAIDVYSELLRAREQGIELYFEDRQRTERGKVWLLPGAFPGTEPRG